MIGTITTAISVIVTTTSTMLNPRSRLAPNVPLYVATRLPVRHRSSFWATVAIDTATRRVSGLRQEFVWKAQARRSLRHTDHARALQLTRSRPSRYSRPVPKRPAVPPTVPPFHAMAMNLAAERRAAEGLDVIHLEVGQPATGAPGPAVAAVRAALDRPLGYTNAPGLGAAPAAARRALPRAARRRHRPGARADRVGRVGRLHARVPRRVRARARVAVVEPGYPCYRNSLIALGMEPVPIVVGPETRWAPTPATARRRRAARRSRGRLTVEPHRHRARRRRARTARAPLRRARHAARRRRDLSRHHVRRDQHPRCSRRPIGRSSSTASRSTSR